MDRLALAKKVVVVGLGVTGLSVVNHLKRQPEAPQIRVIDTRVNPPGHEQLPADVALSAGEWQMDWLLDADLIVANPGVALSTPSLKTAAAAGIPIVGDIELFAWAADKPVVAITGSNGKSTVTSLVGEMAREAGIKVGVGGNIGLAALNMLGQQNELYVLELSSFQLETTASLDLVAAAYLNLSEDHMDRYDSLTDYGLAKQRIYRHAQLAISNRDDTATLPVEFAGKQSSFGFDEQDYGLIQYQQEEYLAVNGAPILPSKALALVGRHNVANSLAALALADAAGIDREASCRVLRRYTGLPHRCQRVVQAHGVDWVNDSKATNLASTLAALNGLSLPGRLHLLVGGDSKGADFAPLKAVLETLNVQLYCFGRDGHRLVSLTANPVVVETLDQAMAIAAAEATAGDMVLLSPACASLDQYPNFMARGDAFAELANILKDQVQGAQVC
ncbi:UDP-N-acetylmuramoyl-L-alanine--D-glutamate ligase [Photobacterium galatheae]|uniref:UDP-N-acetylmuramoylalanine--D-glutamate ligase n=1 Tax=Photobacterium galatheae TaxID=1654360 RepID=A0A066RYK3_9GAMM|nr:UDP-N-acetylmuramoyl-L-alanine--D-glutamate ligase [Photobacterium galatheae]KDM92742.1 UDP-N-acetylmuramoyl-L-alanyl-D-glutamate synthetase [Photobacterium galatheae]MCM0149341.1 UDP-N-acetylmuramoyl-L-alanine--D-glutamate ligase [Photobacterium galatheae]